MKSRMLLWGTPLAIYWLALFTISFAADAPPGESDYMFPLLVMAGLPIYVIAARAIVRDPANDQTGPSLAYVDDLTGLGNRRAFVRETGEALRRSKPGEIGLVMIDVNGLKQLNDDCGHQAGDELLISIADHLSDAGGKPYRIGGDEFALVLEGLGGAGVNSITPYMEPYMADFRTCGHRHEVRVSSGSTSNQSGDTVEAFLRRADSRLLRHKRTLVTSSRAEEARRIASGRSAASVVAEEIGRPIDLRMLS